MPRSFTIFADGPAPSPVLRKRLARGRFTLALDGAAELARRARWRPDLLAGDFDTVKPATLKHFADRGVPLLHTPDQNFTDLEKAVEWCIGHGAQSIWIAGAFGGHVDHSFVNLALLKRFADPRVEITLWQENERVRFVRDARLSLTGRAGRRIAVLPFPSCRVRSQGLAFEMSGDKLALGGAASACNAARARAVKLRIEGEALVVEGL